MFAEFTSFTNYFLQLTNTVNIFMTKQHINHNLRHFEVKTDLLLSRNSHIFAKFNNCYLQSDYVRVTNTLRSKALQFSFKQFF